MEGEKRKREGGESLLNMEAEVSESWERVRGSCVLHTGVCGGYSVGRGANIGCGNECVGKRRMM